MSVNKVILIGNVGSDPVVKSLEGGSKVANFSVATSENYTNKSGEKVSNTEWHNIVAWRGLADVAEKYIRKGSMLYIEGKITTRSWEKDGQKHFMTEILADTVRMLGKKPEGQPNQQNEPPITDGLGLGGQSDDLPF